MSEAKLDLILSKIEQVMEDVSGLKQDVSVLKQDVSDLKKEIVLIHQRLDRHEEMINVKNPNVTVAALTERQESLEQKYLRLYYSIEILNREQLKMKTEIEMLKK